MDGTRPLKVMWMAVKFFTGDDKLKQKHPQVDIGFAPCYPSERWWYCTGTGPVESSKPPSPTISPLKEKAAAFYSFNKGTSTQSYPGSMMAWSHCCQDLPDAQWYKSSAQTAKEGWVNLSLKSWNENQGLPQILMQVIKWNDLRADKIGDEFGVQYIIKGGGNEYQRIKDIAFHQSCIYSINSNYPGGHGWDLSQRPAFYRAGWPETLGNGSRQCCCFWKGRYQALSSKADFIQSHRFLSQPAQTGHRFNRSEGPLMPWDQNTGHTW